MISSWPQAPNATKDPEFVFLALLCLLLQTCISNSRRDTFSWMETATQTYQIYISVHQRKEPTGGRDTETDISIAQEICYKELAHTVNED